jgi:uncharacterized membrane protein (UPF0127 family)
MERRGYVTSRGVRLRVEVPETRLERMRGLLGREGLEPDEALLLTQTRSVHTVRMRFTILVALLGDGMNVLETRVVRPGRLLRAGGGTRHVLELAAATGVRAGDLLLPDEGANQGEQEERGEREDRREGGDEHARP